MINRRSCFRLIASIYTSNNTINHHQLCRHICRRYFMAAAVTTTFSVSRNDLFRCFWIPKSSFTSASSSSAVDLNFGGGRGRRSICLRLKGCGAGASENVNNKRNDKSSGLSNAGDGGGGFGLHKARAIAPSLQQELLRELASEEIRFRLENSFDGGGDDGGRCQSDRAGCLGFPEDRHLLPEKIVVAVDVDEGIYLFPLSEKEKFLLGLLLFFNITVHFVIKFINFCTLELVECNSIFFLIIFEKL